jgi:DNA excision repair protein ERCC-5
MGVHSLWQILEPSARPVRLESLSRKRMAVDASIWIYQFLKAVRSSEGSAMRSSHVVGFFRRVCKLLFFGIQPVFVFDGGAPALKKEVIRRRRERRLGKRQGAEKTAQKLLAMQLQKKQNHLKEKEKNDDDDDDIEYHYLDEKQGSLKPETKFKGSDEYDLPKIEGFEYSKNDQRFVSEEDYKTYKEQVVDDLEGIDLNTTDPASSEFEQLSLATQYMVLSQLRLRSRLRMGYTKEQLENIFPESMDFSKFQIQMVQKRNYFTQRLMGMSGMGGIGGDSSQEVRRIAGERDREYRLQKTDGGWALSLEDETGTSMQKPVDLEKETKRDHDEPVDSGDEDIEWEDVSLENKEKRRINQSISSLPLPPSTTVSAADSTLRSFTFSPSKSKVKKLDLDYDHDDEHEETLKHIEEIELMEAIQKSREDLKKQKELERQMLKRREEETEDAVFENIPFDFEDDQDEMGKKIESQKTQDPPPPIVILPRVNNPLQSEERRRTDMDHLLSLNSQKSTEITPKATILSVPELSEVVESESKSPSISVPSWFTKSSILNPYQQKQKDAIQAKHQAETLKRKDESIGLVSWGEAQELLQSKEEDDDVQVVEPTDIEANKDNEPKETEHIQETERTAPENTAGEEKPESRPPLAFEYEFYEDEEGQLNEQLEKEEQEHEQFQKDLNPHILAFIDSESDLKEQQRRDLRDADEVTVTMIREVQDLLSRFGIPYITAPMEAEAQCAELLKLRLVDGIITDDSDVFLFGGDRVYRNMFHEKHYVEFYNDREIAKLGLDRTKLIELAHLLGSDYTEGLKSVGPVIGMEILAHFGGLEQFREWFMGGQFDMDKQKDETPWEKSLRKKLLKNDVILDKSFPDKKIDEAYLAAEVDHDKTEFVWGTPDLDQLRTFLISTVGWSQERVDQVLVPLIRDLNKKKREGTQSTLAEFYDVDRMPGVKRKRMNKRMDDARVKMVTKMRK